MKAKTKAPRYLSLPALAALLTLTWQTPLYAEGMDAEQWNITADRLVRYENPASVIAEGNVVLEKKEKSADKVTKSKSTWDDLLGPDAPVGEKAEADKTPPTETITTTIKADWVAYDVAMGQAKARGNVYINVKGDELRAESGTINLKDATGSFENAIILRQDQLHLEGRTIEKTGELTYRIEDGWVLTCKLQDGETPPWSFGASDTKITDGGYAVMKNAVFRVRNVPIFYTPYLILPAKHERQTGLLFPSWTLSDRDGFGIEQPLFINLSQTADFTLYPRYMTERGLMMGGEFRYALGENSQGMFMAHYLDDALSDPSEEAYYSEGNYTHTNQERYWIRGKADQQFGAWVGRLDLDIVSDKDYLREFTSASTAFTENNNRFYNIFGRSFEQKLDQYRENSARLLRSFEDGSIVQAEVMGINDVSDAKYDADHPSQFWKLPSLSYSGLRPIGSSPADLSWDTSYTHFWREDGVRSQRIDLFPEFSTSVPLSRYLETSVKAGIRDTFYMLDDNGATDWKNEDTANRWLYQLGGEAGTTLYREYGQVATGGSGISHMVRPFIEYEYLEIPDTDTLPRFDTIDDIEEANIIYYGVNNFFSLFSNNNGEQTERELLYLKVRQGYDLRSEMSDAPWRPVEFETSFTPLAGAGLKYSTALDMYGDGLTEHSVEAHYYSDRGDMLTVDYRLYDKYNIDSISGSLWLVLPYNFALGYSIERSLEQRLTLEEKFKLVYQPACWSVELASNYTPDDTTLMLIFRLANIGSPFGFNLGGAGL